MHESLRLDRKADFIQRWELITLRAANIHIILSVLHVLTHSVCTPALRDK